MDSIRTGRMFKHAAIALATAFVLAAAGCNIAGTLWDLNRYGVGALGGSSSLGI